MESTTTEKILACARKLVMAGGYNSFSYADIAAEVGIRKPSIHHHFPSKVDLVRVLVQSYRAEVKAGLEQVEAHSQDPAQQLRLYVGYWQACIADGSMPFCVGALLAGELPALPPELAVEIKAHFRLLSDWLESVLNRGAEAGSLTLANDAHTEAEVFMATVHGAMLSARAYGKPEIFGVIVTPLLERLASSKPN